MRKYFGKDSDYHYFDIDIFPVENGVVIDGGACLGNITDCFLENDKFKTPQLYLFEPNRTLYNRLIAKYTLSNVHIFNSAIVGNNSNNLFYEVRDRPRWGTVCNVLWSELVIDKYEVETVHINNLLNLLKIDHIDYLKLDVEGVELDIIQSIDTCVLSSISQLSIECHTNICGKEVKKLISQKLCDNNFKNEVLNSDIYSVRMDILK